MSLVRQVTGQTDEPVTGWELCSVPAGAVADPAGLERSGSRWRAAVVPGTSASALRATGEWSFAGPPRRFDAEEWWWRTTLPPSGDAAEVALCFDGLATLADVWLDGVLFLSSTNMFLGHERLLDGVGGGQLVVRCRSIDAALETRRPRPRWRAPMVEHQQLRWLRTTLLGRTPGWSPPAAAVGPWRPVRLCRRRLLAVDGLTLDTRVLGPTGVASVVARVRSLAGAIRGAWLVLERHGVVARAPLAFEGGVLEGQLVLPNVALWWPHTHGSPALYTARIEVDLAGVETRIELRPVGFRTLGLELDGVFRVSVNGVPIFCRGACWTPLDPVTLGGDRQAYAAALDQVAAAGMNMLRVSGAMTYETEDFHDLTDERGILVWQDLMFANMDYPEDDPDFAASVASEVGQVLARLRGRPSVALLCGNSEGEQQAAMWGAPREVWQQRLFADTFPALVRAGCPDVPYWPSSAHGGAFPHQADVGTSSYYGVGAYRRPLEDARRAEVKFASECLAFANIPASRTLERLSGGSSLHPHHPAWKARTPRDLGAGWDFDDVRDHYLARLYGVDPVELRSTDPERYLALGRVATGEVMAAVFGEWRRAASASGGGLVWFLKDLWAGAGWGLIDSTGLPKAPYYFLRRALAPVAAHISDEGGNGLVIHVANDGPDALALDLDVTLFRGETAVGHVCRPVGVPERGAGTFPLVGLLDAFVDSSYAYRFGPPGIDLVAVSLRGAGTVVAEAFHQPLGLGATSDDLGLVAEIRLRGDGDAELTIRTRAFARAIAIDVEGFNPDEDVFHLAPGAARSVRLRRDQPTRSLRGSVHPSNARTPTRVSVAS